MQSGDGNQKGQNKQAAGRPGSCGSGRLRNGVVLKNCGCTKKNGLPVDECICEKPTTENNNPKAPQQTRNKSPQHLQRSPVTCPPQPFNPNNCPPPQIPQRPLKTCMDLQQERMIQGLPPMECPIQTPALGGQNVSGFQTPAFQPQFPPMQVRQPPSMPPMGAGGQHINQQFNNLPPSYTQANCECPSPNQPKQQQQSPPPPTMLQQLQQQQHQQQLLQQQQTTQQQNIPNNANPNQQNPNLNEAQCYHFLTSQGQLKPLPIPGTFQHVQPLCQCEGQPTDDYSSNVPNRPLPCTEHRYDIPCSYCLHSH